MNIYFLVETIVVSLKENIPEMENDILLHFNILRNSNGQFTFHVFRHEMYNLEVFGDALPIKQATEEILVRDSFIEPKEGGFSSQAEAREYIMSKLNELKA
ncbi:hypothetical protein [Methylovirgula sp. 4M-Z18]|uniref:hypothetical protein n=1 Tax=Methylovirgula sp. 4M-Z18 TaxID=2293567 RepID=UPI000E2FDCBD|nr:hypothetical protein [Methylovirgula sp. 4M-Z18]RFB79258.1 hypothetical protein DYH55_11825 [Methylovirgula sp. 4M-Z18]